MLTSRYPFFSLRRARRRRSKVTSRPSRRGPSGRHSRLEICEDRLLLTFHLWKIDQVFSSSDGKVQFIELHDPSSGESHLGGRSISSNENSFTFPADLPTDATANQHFLIGTVDYAKQPGAAKPDYTVPDNFFNPAGDTFNYADVDSFSFTAAQMPTDGVNALFRDVGSGSFSTGPNSETNLAGQSGSVTVSVQVNLPPTINPIADQTILPNSGQQTIDLSGISGGAGENETVTVTASSNNAALIPDPTVGYTSPNSTGTLNYTPVANATGTATITLTLKDNGGTANGGQDTTTETFKINVQAPNKPPTIEPIADPPPLREDSQQPVTVNLTGLTPGAGQSNETLTVTAASSNPALVPNPTVDYTNPNAAGTLTFTPLPGFFGTATITVTVMNSGGTANGGQNTATATFHVTVAQVNDPPTIAAIPDQTFVLNSGPQTINLTGISAGQNESQTITITAASDNPSLIPNPAVSYTSPGAAGTLLLTPTAGATGSATITVTLQDDGGTANGGQDTTVKTFRVQVVVDPKAVFVQHLFEDLLKRAPSSSESQNLVGELNNGTSQAAVAGSVLNSNERAQIVVEALYQKLLGRAADPGGLSFFMHELVGGTDEDAVVASIAGSAEFFHDAGGSGTAFVEALYHDLLGRDGEAQGMAFWTGRLNTTGVTSFDIAQGFTGSREFRTLRVDDPNARFAALDGWYQTYFQRHADSGGLSIFAGQLGNGATSQAVELEMLASPEYFQRNG